MTERFSVLAREAAAGELDAWAASPHRLLALILLLDQIPRNIHRGTARAFSQDTKALQLAYDGMKTGADAGLSPIQRVFLYMPLQHCESPDVQEESVAAFRRLAAEAPPEHRAVFDGCLHFAELHQRIVNRFGRFLIATACWAGATAKPKRRSSRTKRRPSGSKKRRGLCLRRSRKRTPGGGGSQTSATMPAMTEANRMPLIDRPGMPW